MAIATIYAHSSDGFIYNINGIGSWDGARDMTTGIVYNTNTNGRGIQVYQDLGRGSGTYLITRTFMWFSVGLIPAGSTINSATLAIKKSTTAAADGGTNIIVKSSAFSGDGTTPLVATDNINYPGYSAGSSMSGAVTDYSSTFNFNTSVVPNGTFCTVTLNANALADITSAAGSGIFNVMLVDYTYDYLDTLPAANPTYLSNTFYFTDQTGTGNDPKLTIDYTAAGYSHDVIGVSSGNIVNVNGVGTSDIVNVIGVA